MEILSQKLVAVYKMYTVASKWNRPLQSTKNQTEFSLKIYTITSKKPSSQMEPFIREIRKSRQQSKKFNSGHRTRSMALWWKYDKLKVYPKEKHVCLQGIELHQ